MESYWTRIEASWAQSQWNTILNQFGHNKFNTFVWGTFGLFVVLYWTVGSFFTIVDLTGRPKFMLKYKIQEKTTPKLTWLDLLDLVKVVKINQLMVLSGLLMVFLLDNWRPCYTIDELPSLGTAVLHLLFSSFMIEILLYYFHRLLHYPPIYKRFHKKHHSWVTPVAISAIYCHPVEQICLNIIPVVAGPFLLASHIVILWTWMMVVVFTSLSNHSGYHLPFLASSEMHDFHHLTFNFNFGVFGVLDRIHETDILFKKSKQSVRHRTLWSLKSAKELFPN